MTDTDARSELEKKIRYALASSIQAPAGKNVRVEPARGLKKIERDMQIQRVMQAVDSYVGERELVVGGKTVRFAHTAVNGDMHLFIDGDHNPIVCPECIQPGILIEELSLRHPDLCQWPGCTLKRPRLQNYCLFHREAN